jgi:SRSO17 transposase
MSELDEFEAYIAELATALGHADREVPFRGYTTGLLLPLERKSVEPMAARVEPARVGAAHQSLHHFVAKAEWSDAALLAAVRASVLPAIVGHGPIEAWIVDDTGMPKKGRHSVGVARQYCGQLGKQETLRGCGDPAPHEVPGGGQPVGGDCSGQPAGRLAALSAA